MDISAKTLSLEDDALLAMAREARQHAYAPYSGFHVGAAVRTGSGNVHAGCNIENASFGLTMCAEQVAVARAVSSGERELLAVAISADGTEPAWPCGRCRQILAQFGPEMTVLCDSPGGAPETVSLRELFPWPFAGRAFTRGTEA